MRDALDGPVQVAAAAVLGAAAGWGAARRRGERALEPLEAALGDAEQELGRAREELRDAEQQRRTLRDALSRHRAAVARLQRSWQAERAWGRELRGQLHDVLARGRTAGGEDDDVHALVLRAAIELVDAEKGLLLSRRDQDGDGELDVVVARGFEHDPRGSALAERFARAVLRRDEIIREDEPSASDGRRSAADEEIESLVATPLYLRDRLQGVVICANRAGGFEEVDDDVLLALGDHAGAALHHGQLHREVGEAHRAVIRALLEATAAREPELHRESSELAVRAVALARDLDLDERERDALVIATLLRGVGQLALPDSVFVRAGPLSSEQRAVVQMHPRIGFTILTQVPALRDVATAVLYHHERFDGHGYPAGLPGRETPVAARALAVLEAFGAITHDRPYRVAQPAATACEELVAAAGAQFDPEIVALFAEQVRLGVGTPRPELAEAILDALPVVPDIGAGDDLEPLAGAVTDGLTMLGNQRALLAALGGTPADRAVALVLAKLDDLADVNARDGHDAGDRMIQVAARAVQRAAARLGGTAYRPSGGRLAVVAPLLGRDPDAVRAEVDEELAGGPRVRTAVVARDPGERGDELLERARRALVDSGDDRTR